MQQGYAWANLEIDSRLVNRFTLRDTPQVQNPYVLFRQLVPVTQVDELLLESKAQSSNFDFSGAAAGHNLYTVPDGKRWHLLYISTAAFTGSTRLGVTIGSAGVWLDASATGQHFFQGNKEFTMEEGDVIKGYDTGNGADNAREVAIWYLEEDAY